MKKVNKDFNFFKNFQVSKDLDNKIYENTIYKKDKIEKKYFLKPRHYVTIGLILIILSLGIITSAAIKGFILKNFDKEYMNMTTITLTGKVKIDKNHDFDCYNNISLSNIENKLGIKLLDFTTFNKQNYDTCEFVTNDKGNVRRVLLENKDTFDNYKNIDLYSHRYLDVKIEFMTQYANEDDEEYFKDIGSFGTSTDGGVEKWQVNYFVAKLGINAAIFPFTTHFWPQTECYFVYNNVYYHIKGYDVSVEQMKEILDNIS